MLSVNEQNEYLDKHIPYRLNSLRAWDLYKLRRKAIEYDKEEDQRKCNWQSEYLDPAFEISIVFARALIQFLGLTCRGNQLEYFVSKMNEDVQVWDVIPGKPPYPISNLKNHEKQHLCNLIKMANKATAHMTTKYSTDEEFESLEPGRELIFNMVLEYVDNINTTNLWWLNESRD
ncbi:MAG: hypothetical protein HQ541_12190 [Mariniphaga sp.]|nr:hypothetical protein [Mariniphaga sp.]